MCAQRAHCETVNSYECESTPVNPLIRPNKPAFDESGIGMEAIASLLSRHSVHTRAAKYGIDLADNTGEVRYGRRVTPFGMGASGIGQRKQRAVDGAGEIMMRRGAKRRGMGKGYRERLPTAASHILIVMILIFIRAHGCPKPRAEDSCGCGLEKPTPQYRRTPP